MWKLATIVATVMALSVSPTPASELDDYIAHVREYRMDATAEMHLSTMASILAGYSSLTYEADPESGRYWPTFQSLNCVSPDADPELVRRDREASDAKIKALVLGLHDAADLDASGFVTALEGSEFRRQIQVGYLANQLASEGQFTLESLGAALGVTAQEAGELLDQYSMIYPSLEELGVAAKLPLFGAPPVPEIES